MNFLKFISSFKIYLYSRCIVSHTFRSLWKSVKTRFVTKPLTFHWTSIKQLLHFWRTHNRYWICFLCRFTIPFCFHKCEVPNYTIYLASKNTSNTIDPTCKARSAYLSNLSEHLRSSSLFSWIRVAWCVLWTIIYLFACFLFSHGVFFALWVWITLWFLSPL